MRGGGRFETELVHSGDAEVMVWTHEVRVRGFVTGTLAGVYIRRLGWARLREG